jgi:hypothetical protein
MLHVNDIVQPPRCHRSPQCRVAELQLMGVRYPVLSRRGGAIRGDGVR